MLWYLRILWSSNRFWFKIYCHIAVAVWIKQQIWCYTVTLYAGLTPGVKMNPCTLVLCSVARVNLAFVRRVHEVTLGSRIDSVCHCRVEKKPPELHVGSSDPTAVPLESEEPMRCICHVICEGFEFEYLNQSILIIQRCAEITQIIREPGGSQSCVEVF